MRRAVRPAAFALCAWAAVALAGGTEPGPAASPTLEDFWADSAIESPQLSPDGTRIAFLTPTAGVYSIALFHLDTGNAELLVRAGKGDITTLFWKGNERIVYGGGSGSYKLLANLSLAGKQGSRQLTGPGSANGLTEVYDVLPADPQHIIVMERRLASLDVETGELLYLDPDDPAKVATGSYVVDRQGVERLRCKYSPDQIELQHRRSNRDEFSTLKAWKAYDHDTLFLGFAKDDDIAYFVTFDDGDLGVLHPFDTRTGRYGPAMATVPGAQIVGAIFSWDRSRLLGLKVEGIAPSAYWLDDAMKRLQAAIDSSMPGRRNWIVSSSADGLVHLILSSTPQDQGSYYVLDMRRHALLPLGRINPRLNPAQMAQVSFHDIKAADGFVFHAVLTVPKHRENEAHPMVVVPQGDLFLGRFVLGFGALPQFLASRGYAVLQVDYRGARGYGLTYRNAGKHELCGKIPSDINDAVRWAIGAGYAQKDRICIFGSGFGGTLALMAITYDSDMYRCAINEDGEPDPTLYAKYRWAFGWWKKQQMADLVGFDEAELAKRSPILAINRLNGPLMNIYSDPDHNLVWDRLESALKRAKRDYVAFRPFKAGIGMQMVDNRIDRYMQIDEFLAENLAGHPAEPGSGAP
jgi:dipeptidyl aminopeptidase/acylaminoacyl peptidase